MIIKGKYYSDEEIRAIKQELSAKDFDEFLVSGIIGYATGSTIIGGLLGGSLLGGLLGDALEGDDDSLF